MLTAWNQKQIGQLIVLICQAAILTVFKFATMCPNEQQSSDNLIVKDNLLLSKYLLNVALVVCLSRQG